MRLFLIVSAVCILISNNVSWQVVTFTNLQQTRTQNSEVLVINLDFPAKDVDWNSDSNQVAIVGGETLQIWDISEGRLATEIPSDFLSSAQSVDWNPQKAEIATLGNRMVVWDIANERNLNLLDYPTNETTTGDLDWNSQGDVLAFSHFGEHGNEYYSQTRLLDVNTRQFHDIGKGTHNTIVSIGWSPDGSRLAESDYHSANVWNTDTGRLAFGLHQTDYVVELAWSPNGKLIAGASACLEACESQNKIQFWDGKKGYLLYEIKSASDVLSVSWSPDGMMLATGNADNTIRIWSMTNRELLLTVEGHTAEVTKVRWSPDGKWIASVSKDNTVRVWTAIAQEN